MLSVATLLVAAARVVPAAAPAAAAPAAGADATQVCRPSGPGGPAGAQCGFVPPAHPNYQRYILSPASRALSPVSLYKVLPRGGSVTNPGALVRPNGKPTVLDLASGNQTSSPLVILDMGKEVGGLVTVTVNSISSPAPTLNACFSESTAYMALNPSQNNGESNYAPGCDTANIINGLPGVPYTYNSDGHLIPVNPKAVPGSFTDSQIRGGFRYLTLYLSSPGQISISKVQVDFTAAPSQTNLRNYAGYFLSSSNSLNNLWYSGAYTTQLDTAAANTLKSWPYTQGETDHANSEMPNTTPSQEVILDGAKRDRDVWQGDLSVEGPVTALSTGDLTAWRNSLAALAAQQVPSGYVPAEGLVGNHNLGEEFNYGTYVMWFVNNMYQYWQYTGDRSFLNTWFPALTKAEAYLAKQVDSTGLLTFDNTGIRGVGPNADPGTGACGTYGYEVCGHLTYVNALYYQTLSQMATLATAEGSPGTAVTYKRAAQSIKATVNAKLWNAKVGAYEFSLESPAAFPQDAQAMAVQSGIASASQAASALRYLRQNTWAKFGSLSIAPNTSGPIAPFYGPLPTGFEVGARYEAATTPIGSALAEQLMKRAWGPMLSSSFGPQSTFWEKVNQQGLPGLQQFTSLAHGWASSPTLALTTDVLGVRPRGAGFRTYVVQPHPGTLHWAEGRVPTPRGPINVAWGRNASNGTFIMTAQSPNGTSGQVEVPTFGQKVQVAVNGKPVWNGSSGLADGAHLAGNYVVLGGLAGGSYKIASRALDAMPTTLAVYANPGVQTTAPGNSGVVRVSVYADGPGTVTGTLAAAGPTGWHVGPSTQTFSLRSDGTPVHQRLYVHYLHIPSSAAGNYPITLSAKSTGGAQATTTASLQVTSKVGIYTFANGSTQGWTPGTGVASVAAVQHFANGPGSCSPGAWCLQASSQPVPADAPKVVGVTPTTPLNLSGVSRLDVYLNSYGGAPGRTGYQATVTLSSGTHALVTTVPVGANTWNEIKVNPSSWPYNAHVTGMSVEFNALNSTLQAWGMDFQIGGVYAVHG